MVQEKTITVEKKVLTESAKGVIKSSPLWKELEQSLSDDQKENITDDQMIRLIAAVQKFAVKEPVENILDENKLKALLPKIRKKIGF
ncbi:MAG: hypothetical protein U9Q15_00010 [Patescibacteria group bacterium]|nr:hypothetical protein [Patescibacteria group bacterium]